MGWVLLRLPEFVEETHLPARITYLRRPKGNTVFRKKCPGYRQARAPFGRPKLGISGRLVVVVVVSGLGGGHYDFVRAVFADGGEHVFENVLTFGL